MATRSLGVLTVDLITRIGGFTAGMTEAERQTEKFRRSMRQKAAELDKEFQKMAISMAAAFAGVSASIANTVNNANEIERFAKLANTTTTEFQYWAAAASTVGISQEKLSDQLKDFVERVGEFANRGTGPLKDFFEEIAPKVGLTAEAFRDLSGPQGLLLFFQSLERAGVARDSMSSYLEDMASDMTGLIPLLTNGGAELDRLGQMAQKTGQIMSEDLIQSARDAQEAWNTLTGTATGLRNELAESLLPVLTGTVEFFEDNETAVNAVKVAAIGLTAVIASRFVGSLGAAAVAFGFASAEAIRYQMTLAKMAGASLTAAAAQRTLGLAVSAAGGPFGLAVGVITSAMLAVYGFRDSNEELLRSLDDLDQPIDKLVQNLERMSNLQRAQKLDEYAAAQEAAVREAASAWDELTTMLQTYAVNAGATAEEQKALSLELEGIRQRGGDLLPVIERVAKSSYVNEAGMRELMRLGGEFEQAQAKASNTNIVLQTLVDWFGQTGAAARDAASGVNTANAAMGGTTEAGQKAIAQLQRQIALYGQAGSAAGVLYDIEQARTKGAGPYAKASAAELELLETEAKRLQLIEQQNKASTSGQSAAQRRAEEQKRALEQQEKKAKEYLQTLSDQVLQVDQLNNYQRLQHDLMRGTVTLSDEQLAKAEGLATVLDMRAEHEREVETTLNRQNAELAAQRQLQALVMGYDADIAGMSMGDRAREEMEQRLQLEQQFADRVQQIDDQRRQALATADDDERARIQQMYDDLLAIEQRYQDQALSAYERYLEAKRASEGDWMVGARSALETWAEESRNVSAQAASFVQEAMSGASDALTSLIMTGEADMQGLIQSLLQNLIQLEMQALMTNIAMRATGDNLGGSGGDVFGLLGSMLGLGGGAAGGVADAAGAAGEAAASAAVVTAKTAETTATIAATTALTTFTATLAAASASQSADSAMGFLTMFGFADGGYTGPGGVYEPAGLVHKGEGVLSQRDMAAIGGPMGFERLRRAIHNGFANGGVVAPGAVRVPVPERGIPESGSGTTVDNRIALNLIDDPDRIASVLASKQGEKALTVLISRNPTKFRQLLGVR